MLGNVAFCRFQGQLIHLCRGIDCCDRRRIHSWFSPLNPPVTASAPASGQRLSQKEAIPMANTGIHSIDREPKFDLSRFLTSPGGQKNFSLRSKRRVVFTGRLSRFCFLSSERQLKSHRRFGERQGSYDYSPLRQRLYRRKFAYRNRRTPIATVTAITPSNAMKITRSEMIRAMHDEQHSLICSCRTSWLAASELRQIFRSAPQLQRKAAGKAPPSDGRIRRTWRTGKVYSSRTQETLAEMVGIRALGQLLHEPFSKARLH